MLHVLILTGAHHSPQGDHVEYANQYWSGLQNGGGAATLNSQCIDTVQSTHNTHMLVYI